MRADVHLPTDFIGVLDVIYPNALPIAACGSALLSKQYLDVWSQFSPAYSKWSP